MKKVNIFKLIWVFNLVLIPVIVYLGIQLGGKGAEIAWLENELSGINERQGVIEDSLLLAQDSETVEQKAAELMFVKPVQVVYIDSQNVLTSNLVR